MKELKIFFYQQVWLYLSIILSYLHNNSSILNLIDNIFKYIIDKGLYTKMNTGLTLVGKKVDNEHGKLTLTYMNTSLWERNMYVGLYYALISNKTFMDYGTTKNRKIFISVAITETREFSLHNNCLYQPNLTLTSYLNYTEPNLNYLKKENYLDNFIPVLQVTVWDIDLPTNKYIKIRNVN